MEYEPRVKGLCENCLKDRLLKEFVLTTGRKVKKCLTCGSSSVKSVNIDSFEFEQAIRAVFRNIYDEWDYNTHFGGEYIETLFLKDKMIFSDLFYHNEDAACEIIDIIFSEGYYEKEPGISLFYGYGDDGQPAGFLEAIKHSYSKDIRNSTKYAKNKDYFKLFSSISDIIDFCEPYIKSEVDGLNLYRARTGVEKYGFPRDSFDFRPEKAYLPYSFKDIGAPPIEYVGKGRMNREGFSFLYLAEDIETAIHEIKPSPGDLVSIGKFKQNRKMRVADFTKISLKDFWKCDETLEIFIELQAIAKFISTRIGSTGAIHYLYTQLISEELLKRDYQAIKFSSSVTSSNNYAIFEPPYFDYISEDRRVARISRLLIDFDTLPLLDKETEIII